MTFEEADRGITEAIRLLADYLHSLPQWTAEWHAAAAAVGQAWATKSNLARLANIHGLKITDEMKLPAREGLAEAPGFGTIRVRQSERAPAGPLGNRTDGAPSGSQEPGID